MGLFGESDRICKRGLEEARKDISLHASKEKKYTNNKEGEYFLNSFGENKKIKIKIQNSPCETRVAKVSYRSREIQCQGS